MRGIKVLVAQSSSKVDKFYFGRTSQAVSNVGEKNFDFPK
jgi:hypothetical protein